MSDNDLLNMEADVKGYVYFEQWLASWCNDHPGEKPSDELKTAARKICRKLAKEVVYQHYDRIVKEGL